MVGTGQEVQESPECEAAIRPSPSPRDILPVIASSGKGCEVFQVVNLLYWMHHSQIEPRNLTLDTPNNLLTLGAESTSDSIMDTSHKSRKNRTYEHSQRCTQHSVAYSLQLQEKTFVVFSKYGKAETRVLVAKYEMVSAKFGTVEDDPLQ